MALTLDTALEIVQKANNRAASEHSDAVAKKQRTAEAPKPEYHSAGVNGNQSLPVDSIHCVTVPGLVSLWHDSVQDFGSGKFTVAELLKPAIRLATEGFPVGKITAKQWQAGEEKLKRHGHGRHSGISWL